MTILEDIRSSSIFDYVEYEMRRDKLKGKVLAVTVTSPPGGTNSDTFFAKFGRVASSSCGGACK